jgi:hypothetical protein
MANDAAALRKQVQRHLARQRELVGALLAMREQLHGSVFERYGRCGKAACACGSGKGHGPYYVLSSKRPEGAGFVYLDRDQARQAKELVAASRAYRRGLAELKALNEALLDLMRRYQKAQARAGARKLSATAAA